MGSLPICLHADMASSFCNLAEEHGATPPLGFASCLPFRGQQMLIPSLSPLSSFHLCCFFCSSYSFLPGAFAHELTYLGLFSLAVTVNINNTHPSPRCSYSMPYLFPFPFTCGFPEWSVNKFTSLLRLSWEIHI